MLSSISVATTCLKQFWFEEGGGPVLGNPNDTACWPLALHVTASPAICPDGYHAACNPVTTLTSQKLDYCCPNGYFCDGGIYSCSSKVGSLTTANGTSVNSNGETIVKLISFSGVNANSVAVKYADSDTMFTVSQTATSGTDSTGATPLPTTSLPLTTSTASTTSNTSGPTTVPHSAMEQTGGLSAGAKAGIGVGVGIAVLLLLGLLAFFHFRNRATSQNQTGPGQRPQQQDLSIAADFQGSYRQQPYQEGQYSSQIQELAITAPAINELDGKYTGLEKSSPGVASEPSELSAESGWHDSNTR
ncbi:hypothetical protein AB5N19_14399 [Seiridium cardinale]|uniref:Uncharacterized protein n=1 Tax=Seiridium cardinale TaxID=138064 RepID=A0ABR2YA78_9PEZI